MIGNDPRTERILLGLLLGILLPLAWMQSSSRVSVRMRAKVPWSAWLALRSPDADLSKPPALYLLVYGWDKRVLHLIQMPETTASIKAYQSALRPARGAPAAELALTRFYASELQQDDPLRLFLRWASAPADSQSPETVRDWMLSWPRTLRFWPCLPGVLQGLRRSGGPEPGAYDALLLALEAFRLEPENLRLHVLPPQRDIAEFFSRIQGLAAPETSGPIRVEILNASEEPGIALQATKLLRWHGLDVVDFGNAPAPSPFTRFIDRTASYRAAANAARAMGCVRPEIMDRMDSGRREQVTVILGRDFRRCALLNGPPPGP